MKLTNHGLKDKPSQIYNCDESGMPLQHKMPKVITTKGIKKVCQCSSGNKTQITILGCANATGQTIPPMVIFSGKNFYHALSVGKFLVLSMGCHPMDGWTRIYLRTGSQTTFYIMLFQQGLYYYCLMDIHHTILWNLLSLQQRRM